MKISFFIYKRRNWYLISVDATKIHFQSIIGIDIDKHLFGASLRFITTGRDIVVHGFSKKNANEIEKYCSQFIHSNTRKGTTEVLKKTIVTTSETSTQAIVSAVDGSKKPGVSVADELKKMKELLDSGVITQAEYDNQKARLLNN
jgi:hypothetical protein